MSDERSLLSDVDTQLPDEVHVENDSLGPMDPSIARATGHSEVLRIRWDTPRGRRVRSLVIRDLRFERSANLAEILADLRDSEQVKGFLDLRFIKLDGENLNGTHLEGADLSGASLAKTSFVSAHMAGARLGKARLVGATVREADLSRADFTDANLTEASFEGTALVAADFTRARCIGTSFARASLVGANMRGAMLVRASFDQCDLGGATVEGAHVLPRAFSLAATKPNGMEALFEVPVTGDPIPAQALDVARMERSKTGAFRAPDAVARERRPSGRISMPDPNARWDAALASLLTQRGRVTKLTALIDGQEHVIFSA